MISVERARPEAALDDLFITHELDKRTSTPPDQQLAKNALQELIARMADAPEDVLPHFVQLAQQLTGGESAGLSLYEPEPGPGVFRWHHLQGLLSPFEGATTPRNHSPCGVTLDRNAPVLSLHPERWYDWISDASIVVPEVLLVPLRVQGGQAMGTLWIVSKREGHFTRAHADIASELAWFVGIAVRMSDTERQLRQALEDQQTLTREMNHRVKNVFAITNSMIRMTQRSARSVPEMGDALSGRLFALANAHALVSPHLEGVGNPPRVSDFETVARAILAPHGVDAAKPSRFVIAGPPVGCGNRSINSLALVLHELATNAVKYGAISNDRGRVRLLWRIEGDVAVLEWSEESGPRIEGPPATQGFGSTLIRQTITRQFQGTIDHAWDEAGLKVKIRIPAEILSR